MTQTLRQRSIFWKSAGHRDRFMVWMGSSGKLKNGHFAQDFTPAHYILTADASTWEDVQPHIGAGYIDFEAILEMPRWSGGYTILLNLAYNLFNGHSGDVTPYDLRRLDSTNAAVACAAIDLFLNGLTLAEIEEGA